MIKVDEFIDFILNNLDDPRVEIQKTIKFGFRHYSVHFLSESSKMNPTINVDVRNKYYSISFDWDEVIIIEDEQRTESIANAIEQKYQTYLPSKIDKMVNKIFKSTDPKNLDFWRDWTIDKLIDTTENKDEF